MEFSNQILSNKSSNNNNKINIDINKNANEWIDLKKKIESTRIKIKEEAGRIYNEVYNQQADLLNRVNRIEEDMNSKLTHVSLLFDSNFQINELFESYLKELNAKLNKDLSEVNQVGYSILSNQTCPIQYAESDLSDDVIIINDDQPNEAQTISEDSSNNKTKNLISLETNINVDFNTWQSIENKEYCSYFTYGNLSQQQKEEINNLRHQVKKIIYDNYGIKTSNSLLRKSIMGYFFTNVCVYKSRTNCKTHCYVKINIINGKCNITTNHKCNHLTN